MMRLTDQYVWNIMFSALFVFLVVIAVMIIDAYGHRSFQSLTTFDFVLMTLATWRLIRLFVYDAVTKFFREQFFDEQQSYEKTELVKPERGPRRTLADLLTCPWCFGIWAAAVVIFFYLLTPYAFYAALLLAVAAVASFLQIFTNMIGWKAEQLKNVVEKK